MLNNPLTENKLLLQAIVCKFFGSFCNFFCNLFDLLHFLKWSTSPSTLNSVIAQLISGDAFAYLKTKMNKKPLKNKPSTSSGGGFFIRSSQPQKPRQEREQQKPNNKKPRVSSSPRRKTSDDGVTKEKKPFDKKQWRLRKYSKKHKLEEWENNRKKVIGRRYNRELKKQPTFDVQKIYEEAEKEENEETQVTSEDDGKKKRMSYKERIEKMQEDKERAREEAIKRREEKKAKIEEYKRKKDEKNRILSKRTKKGQPIMKGRLELLLQQIQESCAKE